MLSNTRRKTCATIFCLCNRRQLCCILKMRRWSWSPASKFGFYFLSCKNFWILLLISSGSTRRFLIQLKVSSLNETSCTRWWNRREHKGNHKFEFPIAQQIFEKSSIKDILRLIEKPVLQNAKWRTCCSWNSWRCQFIFSLSCKISSSICFAAMIAVRCSPRLPTTSDSSTSQLIFFDEIIRNVTNI
jgi:hypothetical protein